MPTENSFVEKMKRDILLADKNAFIFRPNDARSAGVPDLFVFSKGACLVFEVKAPASEPRDKAAPWLQHDFSPLQVAFLKNVNKAGCPAYGVIYVMSTGAGWLIPADVISVQMSFDYVKNNGRPIADTWFHGVLWRARAS